MTFRRWSPEELRDDDPLLRLDKRRLDKITTLHLGPLLVDFDDLRDLVELLASGDRAGEPVEIHLLTGIAPDVETLRKVSDPELAEGMTVRVGDVEVELNRDRTRVTGPRITAIGVRVMWAKFRRTQAWSRYGGKFWAQTIGLSSLSVATLIYGLFVQSTNPGSQWWVFAALILLAVLTPTVLVLGRRWRGTTVVFPGSRQERRDDRPLQRRHRFQMGLTIVGSILVPVTTLVLTLVLKK